MRLYGRNIIIKYIRKTKIINFNKKYNIKK